MNPELWQKVEELFHQALEQPMVERQTFLAQSCGQDDELRQEVEMLLARDAQAASFLEVSAIVNLPATLAPAGSLVGRTVGPYRIVSPLGAGGMGEVYRAHDSKLERDVAIKTLPHAFARDPGRLARLRREARTLASLNHPNIAAVYGLEESGEADYLIMELVEGETLRGTLPVATALDRACQVASALEAAHEKGIIHRDLKPGNVKVTPQGRVKVLDFGLAKAIWGPEGNQDLAQLDGATGMESVAGQIVGTPGYMSPEQARGEKVDKRADVWAFGCLLYELLTGKKAFPGETLPDTITAVLENEPDWHALPAKTPGDVRELLRRCMHKDASRRLADIANARRIMESALRGSNRWRSAVIASATLALLAVGTICLRSFTHWVGSANRPAIQALAVLPLENVSHDPQQEYFADGMTEALISELGRITSLRVISRQSVVQYRGTHKSLLEIARELKVDAILGGAVERSGDNVRVTMHLSQALPAGQMWAKTYNSGISDVLVLQDEIARAVTDEVRVNLTPQEKTSLASAHRINPEAHDAFLRGQYFANKQTEKDLQLAIGYFKEAAEIDPGYARAFSGLAWALLGLGNPLAGGGSHSTDEILPQARAATAKALELDPALAEAHTARATIQGLDWNWAEEEKEYQLALKLSPNLAPAYGGYAVYLEAVGRSDEAIAQIHAQIQLNPLSDYEDDLAFAAFMARKYDAAIQGFKKAKDYHALGWSYAMKQMYPEAITAFDSFAGEIGRQPVAVSGQAMVYGLAGRKRESQKFLRELKEIARHRYVSPNLFVNAYLGAGDRDQALTWLEKAYADHDALLVWLKVGPGLDPLRAEPRFQAVLRRMNFPD